MKTIGIIGKPGKPEPAQIMKGLVPWLMGKGFTVMVDNDAARVLAITGYPKYEIAAQSDMIVVLGGDGTMLAVARMAAQRDIPILGINLGGLGFITEVNKDEVYEAIDNALSQKCTMEERLMLDACVVRKGKEVACYTVLNDVVINKGALARIFDTETYINGRYVTTFKADGVIISTPTGSTGYSLSAGGPILYPSLHCMLITPICPHTLTNRPLAIEDDMVIEAIMKTETEDVFLTLDGQVGFHLKQDDTVRVQRSLYTTKLIIPAGRDYFQILRAKLRWGER